MRWWAISFMLLATAAMAQTFVTAPRGVAGAPAVVPQFLFRANSVATNQSLADQQVLATQSKGVQDGNVTVSAADGVVAIVSNAVSMTWASSGGALFDDGVVAGVFPVTKPTPLHGLITPGIGGQSWFGTNNIPWATTGNSAGIYGFWLTGNNVYVYSSYNGGAAQQSEYTYVDATTQLELMLVFGGSAADGTPWDGVANFLLYPFGAFAYVRDGSDWVLTLPNAVPTALVSNVYLPPYRQTGITVSPARVLGSDASLVGKTVIHDGDYSAALTPTFRDIAVALNDSYTGTADQFIRYKITTLPSAGNLDIQFRRTSATEVWTLRIGSDGSADLRETTGGSTTSRGTLAAATFASGSTVYLSMRDQAIYAWADTGSRIAYTSAASNKTATGVLVSSLGTGGAVAYIVSYPKLGTGLPAAMSAVSFTSPAPSNPSTGAATKQLSDDGDSLYDGDQLNHGGVQTYLYALMGGSWTVSNFAVGGSTIADLVSREAAVNASFNGSNARNVFVVWAGTNNGYTLGQTGATAAAAMCSYLTTMEMTWGTHIIVLAMLPRTQTGGMWNPDAATFRTAYNSGIKTCVDNDGLTWLDPTVLAPGLLDSTDLTFYRNDPAGVHLNYFAEGLVARQLYDLIGR